ncbi:MAG TPA: sulfatase-like hydrolase/transferase, partial [Acidobacteriota bacterium]|nr:sulfatase-like hydrolase/transferase [Acidobacteriota bacterium]
RKTPLPHRHADMNVLLITIDTLRADHLSCYGSKAVATPEIDALAARGVRFANAIVQVPLTAPSHASILTGTYPELHKIRDMGGFVLDERIPTLATILNQSGFESAAFVGAAVLSRYYGMNRGFDVYRDEMQDERSQNKLPGVVAEVRGEIVAQRAIEWLNKATPSKNFFIWAHFYDPHFPYDPPQPYRARYVRDLYSGEVAYADEQVGKLLRALAARGFEANTLVVLLADHGESLGDHGEFTHGVFLYDSTVHIPMMIAGPGVPKGGVVPQQVRSIDVMPTIADFLGISAGPSAQGVSLRRAIVEGKPPGSNFCYMETIYPRTQMGWSELRGLRTDQFKLIVAPKPELYRLADDQHEAHNVIDKLPADADRLQKKVREIAGSSQSLRSVQPRPIDEKRQRELNALGYVSSGRRTIRTDTSGPDPKDRVHVLAVLEKASDAMNHDRWKEAISRLEGVLPEDLSNPLLYKNLILSYQRSGQFDKMEQTCRRAIENKAESDETYASLGEIQIRSGDIPRAIEFMEKAAHLNPSNIKNMNNLATAYLQQDRREDTERVLRAALAQSPNDATAHNVYGNLEVQRGRLAEAQKQFELATELDPNLAEPYVNLGLIAQNTGNTKGAISYYEEFLKKADKDKFREYIPKVKAALTALGAGK